MATWAKGVDFKNSANTARVGGVGIYGTDGSAQKAYLGIGTEPWNKTGLEVTSSEVSFKGNKVYHAGSKPTPAEIGAAASNHTHNYAATSHNHGLLHDSFGVTIADTTTDNGWSMINSSYNGFLLKSLRSSSNAPAWLQGNYSAGIAFGGADTKGVMSVAYSSPSVRFAGGNGSKPVWYFTVNGSSGKTYNMDSLAANTANTLATARTINGTSFNGSANITTANWGTARNLQIGNTAKSVNGSANVSWSLSEIGAAAASHNHSNMLTFKSNHTTDWTSASSMSGKTYMGGWHGKLTSGTTGYVSLGADGSNTLDLMIDGDIYVRENSKVYHSGNKPTPSDIGAAPASHTHNYVPTSAGGNIIVHADSDSSTTTEYLALKAGHNILQITSSGGGSTATQGQDKLTFNGNIVYHAGRKPTVSEIGAAAASHTHNYAASPSAGGSASTVYLPRTTGASVSANYLPGANKFEFKEFGNDCKDIPNANWYHIFTGQGADGNYNTQLALGMTTQAVYYRNRSGAWGGWKQLAFTDSSISGNASTATKLQTARTINGTSFDGTANITTANWGTARNIQIGNTVKSVNGGANVSWSLSEIGALSLSGGTLTGLLSTPNNQMGIRLGDDVLIGDGNIANNMVLQGGQDSTLGGITFGSGKDTNIYRGGANLLKTDDTMNAVGGFQWNGQSLDERYFARRGNIDNTTNWNSIVHPGCYKVQQASWGNAESTHAPCQGYSYGLLMVYRTNVSNEDRLYQVYMPHRTEEPRWYRMCNNGSWDTWKAQDVRDSADRRYVKGNDIKLSVEGDILNSSALTTSRKQLIAGSADKVYAGNTSANLILESSSTPQVRINNNFYPIYHTGNKPTASEIGAAPAGYGLGTTCTDKSGQNCNDILVTGFYRGSNMTNKPSGCTQGWIYLLVMSHDNSSWVRQVAYDFGTASQVYTRVKQNGSWTAWVATDTNTWRGVQDNLTSTATDQSLSANQGKVLKGLIDGKAASNHTHNYAGSSSAGGAANSAVKLATARTIALGGILSGSASFDGSGNVTINAAANDITTITKSLNVTTSWADTGITGSNLGTGTYAVQMYINDGANTNQWTEYYSGIMSWFNGGTNSTDADEILLHKAGHASNGRHLYLRTIRTSNGGYLKLQISCTHAFSAASSITFKFKKLI